MVNHQRWGTYRQPSQYAHFESKHALHDAMFADDNRQLLGRLEALALEDTERCYLILQRPIPGFEPSTPAYGHAEQVMDRVVEVLRVAGVEDQDDIDGFIALARGSRVDTADRSRAVGRPRGVLRHPLPLCAVRSTEYPQERSDRGGPP